MILLALVLFGLYLYFPFVKLNSDLILSEQWKNYVNPLNQSFFRGRVSGKLDRGDLGSRDVGRGAGVGYDQVLYQ
jgi:hypothetical protein